ncbi:hypothetical protein FRC12_003379 [Ceratobasidium sp. 428]|nr:hypothetical protein FRC12_003379 [Ceratobasidium sp. 428]
MPDPQAPKKKQKITPPCPSRASAGVIVALRVDHMRSQSVPDVTLGVVVPSSQGKFQCMYFSSEYLTFQSHSGASAIPTPAQTVRKATYESNAIDSGMKPALPRFGIGLDVGTSEDRGRIHIDTHLVLAIPQPRAQEIAKGSSDEDDEEEESESEEEKAAGNASSDEYEASDDGEKDTGGDGENGDTELVVDARGRVAEGEGEGGLEGRKEEIKLEKSVKVERSMKVEEDMKVKLEPTAMTDAQKNTVPLEGTLKCFLSMRGRKHAREAGCLVPRYDKPTGDPI